MPSTLDRELGRLFDAGVLPGTISAYLFGSQATGRAHRESDVDLGVLLDRATYRDERRRFDARLRLAAQAGRAFGGAALDVVVLNDAPPQLAREIVTRGRRVFCGDPDADHVFRRTVLSRAADLEPFLRRTRRVKVSALRR